MKIHQWVPAAHRGDAIGDSARAVRDLLRGMGHTSEIFALTIDDDLRGDVLPFADPAAAGGDVTIFHFALPSPMTEAFARLASTAQRLEQQLADIQAEFVSRRHLYRFDRLANQMSITPILSWREAEFVAAYDKADAVFAQRSPIERAIIAFISPHLLPLEKELVAKNQFKIVFHEMDWRLNDLTSGARIE